ncbi:hypothetical protein ACLF3G_22490 [Falsiroseomonas sp. HC035]|uniref:hypothetical protein n=1 Tax=Falsiroseomonas sp. HC035 TaxID=3390999 RepID=UPI003D3107E9
MLNGDERCWSDDRFWTEALDGYLAARDAGIVLDLGRIKESIFNSDDLLPCLGSIADEGLGLPGRGGSALTLAHQLSHRPRLTGGEIEGFLAGPHVEAVQ